MSRNIYHKNILYPLMLLLYCGLATQSVSQPCKLKIEVLSDSCSSDSLYLQHFENNDFVNFMTVKCRQHTVFQQQQPIVPGLYLLTTDSIMLTEILISDTLHQKFKIILQKDSVSFENSDENNANIAYHHKLQNTDYQMSILEQQFYETSSAFISEQDKKAKMDSLKMLARTKMQEIEIYKQNISQQFPNALITSLLHATTEIPEPPSYVYQNQILMIQYEMEHFFDVYPFEDERLLNTPIAFNKFRQYAVMLYKAGDILPDSLVDRILDKAQVSEKTYNTLFNIWQDVIGDISSPFWTEDVYIEMLKHTIQYDKLDALQTQFYKFQLSRFDKNRKGSLISDFAIVLPDSTKTNIYSIEGEYILLYFQNTDCPTCVEVCRKLDEIETLNQAIKQGKIKVITVYFEKDKEVWQHYIKENANHKYINTWNYNNEIEAKGLFDLSIIPYMFLLDKDKRVIEKDISVEDIKDFLDKL